MLKHLLTLASLCICGPLLAQDAKPFDAAAAFGARPSISDLSLSPDGAGLVFVVPTAGQGSAVFTRSLGSGAKEQLALAANGKPDRLPGCDWVSDARLVCWIHGITHYEAQLVPFTRVVAADADGKNLQLLSTRDSEYTLGFQLFGGAVIDWLPGEDSAVLMTRNYVPGNNTGNMTRYSSAWGLGVDRIDTRTLAIKRVELPSQIVTEYISDGRGTVRILGRKENKIQHVDSGVTTYM